MTEDQQQQLQSLIGKEITYKAENYVLKSFKQVVSTVVINTDAKKIVLGVKDELPMFLFNQINARPVNLSKIQADKPAPETKQQNIPVNAPEQTIGYESVIVTKETSAIESALLNVLQLVQESDANIPKAAAVCNIIDSAVKVERQKLEINKYLDKKYER